MEAFMALITENINKLYSRILYKTQKKYYLFMYLSRVGGICCSC